MTAPLTTEALWAGLLPLLAAQGWKTGYFPAGTSPDGLTRLYIQDRTRSVKLAVVQGPENSPRAQELLSAVVATVEQAVAHLRAAGVLPADPTYMPASPWPSGKDELWRHGCGHVEPWSTDPAYLASEHGGPITEQGCDACEGGPDGTWRQLFVAVTS